VNSEPGNPEEWSDPSKPEKQTAPDAEKIRDAIIDPVKSVKSAAETYTSMPVYIGVTIKSGQKQGVPTMGGMTININLPPYKYVDPTRPTAQAEPHSRPTRSPRGLRTS
jgi:hypothetical protein